MSDEKPDKSDRPPKKSQLVRARREPEAAEAALGSELLSTPPPKVPLYTYRREAYFPDIIPGVLPVGSANIFSGPTRAGKSTLLAQMIASLLKGEPVFGEPCRRPMDVVYVALDHSWRVYQHTFDQVGVGLGDIRHYALRDDTKVNVAHELHEKVEKHGTYSAMELLLGKVYGGSPVPPDILVIVDPIHPLCGKDINDYSKVQLSLNGIGQYCGHRQVTVLGTAHTAKVQFDPKKQYVRAIDRAAGSTALGGYSETVFSLVIPQELAPPNREGQFGKVYEWHWGTRHQPEKVLYLMRDPDGTGLFVTTESQEPEAMSLEALALKPYFTPGQPTKTAEIVEAAAQAGIAKRTVERYLQTLYTAAGRIRQVKKGVWVWPKEN